MLMTEMFKPLLFSTFFHIYFFHLKISLEIGGLTLVHRFEIFPTQFIVLNSFPSEMILQLIRFGNILKSIRFWRDVNRFDDFTSDIVIDSPQGFVDFNLIQTRTMNIQTVILVFYTSQWEKSVKE